ncbi:HAMP domain-containing sensor histidine kinase [Paraflavisolibacter sp. H34]|uniref:HAMP domain-containing sensor histidine kinase n=1 Tax=Huijunlia imazamoxiresistens TaxID=3127457 RepID=UPI003017BB41
MKRSFLNTRLPKRNLVVAGAVLLFLSLLSSYFFRVAPSIGMEVKALESYIHRQQEDFADLVADGPLMRRLVQDRESLEEFQAIAGKKFSFFLYAETLSDRPEPLFWSNQKELPAPGDLGLQQGTYFRRLANGYYVVEKRDLHLPGMTNRVVALALIPVYYQFSLETEYLQTRFVYDKDAVNKISISEKRTPYVVRAANTHPLFYVARKTHQLPTASDPITLLLRISAMLLLLAYIYFVAESLVAKKGIIPGVLFLAAALFGIRLVIYLFPGLFYFRQFQLFDPSIYGTNAVNRSLGDLLINTITLCWIAVFAWYNIGPVKRLPSWLQGNKIYGAGAAALGVFILSGFQWADIVRSLVADSHISFNVSDFFSLNIYTFVGFIVLALLSLTFYYITRLLFQLIFLAFRDRTVYIYFLLAFLGLLFLTFRSGHSSVAFHLPVLLWLVLYTWLVSQEQFIINHFKINMAGVLFWIFIFSISLSAVILHENKKKEWIYRKSIAEKHDELTDPSQERTLSITLKYLDEEFLLRNFPRFLDEGQNRNLRDSILNVNILAFRSGYNMRLYLFDSTNTALYNDDPRSYNELNNIFTVRSKPTGIPDLYYHETSYDNLSYITRRMIEEDGHFHGTCFIIATPKKHGDEAFYPEIFRNMKQFDVSDLPTYSYAIYDSMVLKRYSAQYPFRTSLRQKELPVSEFERRENGDFDELWFRASSSKVVVVARKQDTLIESITLFSYLFCAFLFMVALLQLIAIVLNSTYDLKLVHLFSQLSIRSQVHGTIIFISILSFLIIGAATISFFISRYNRNNVDKLNHTSGILVREMEQRLADSLLFDKTALLYDSASSYKLQRLIDELADIHNVDVNLYDLRGSLQVSSRADVYKLGVLSTRIHPQAYYHLNRRREVLWVQEEKINTLKYLSIYAAVRDKKGGVYAYLNIPYFLSQNDLNQEISNFLVTIINLNAFIFLIAGVIALFITNKITRSFSIIGQKMKEITLGKTNEEIVWVHKDEIGDLVEQYNKMVKKLEQSAEALAKSEREGAWREMARQVAHEIKNPLTPMKLSIQYLQKAIHNNHPNVKELTSSVANTLVEQIDHLSKIAADFSRFANIGNRHMELFDFHQVIASLVDLYRPNPRIELHWNHVDETIWMMGDRTHINRLFTNLLTNAVEACPSRDKCVISIDEELEGQMLLVSVTDNGDGIPPDMHAKIFVPNFTTKSSGTGLGLAMCKRIVEQAGGDIWFETEPGAGTTFFVRLPIADDAEI